MTAPLSKQQSDELSALHHRAIYAARQFTISTPGTRTHVTRENAWEKAEKKFSDYLMTFTESE